MLHRWFYHLQETEANECANEQGLSIFLRQYWELSLGWMSDIAACRGSWKFFRLEWQSNILIVNAKSSALVKYKGQNGRSMFSLETGGNPVLSPGQNVLNVFLQTKLKAANQIAFKKKIKLSSIIQFKDTLIWWLTWQ